MTRTIIAAAALALLAGCSMLPQIAVGVTRAALPPEALAAITETCRRTEPLIRLAGALPLPAAGKEIAAFVAGYCDPMLAGSVPPTTDGNTGNWLAQNLTGLRAALALVR